MTYRKNSVSCWSMRVFSLLCLMDGIWILVKLYPFSSESMPLLWLIGGICGAMLLLLVFNPWNQRLQIDDAGIRCLGRRGILWSFAWDELEAVRSVTVHGCRGYVIVPKVMPVPAPDYTLERTGKIKAALERYAPAQLSNTK